MIPSLALLEFQLNTFKNDPNSTTNLVKISSIALKALEYKLTKIREIVAYSVGMVLDPTLNKRLAGICEKTKWDYGKVYIFGVFS